MSEDIDFTEIDELMAEMDNDIQTKRAIAVDVSTDEVVIEKKSSAKKTKPKVKVSKTKPKTEPEDQPEKPVEYKPNPRVGKFMDMVHPMSDMSIEPRPDRQAPPVVIKKTVAAQAIILVESDIEPDSDVIDDAVDDGLDLEENYEIDEVDSEFDTSVLTKEEDAVEPPEIDEIINMGGESTLGVGYDTSYSDLDVPFLENVEVEKRPLGGNVLATNDIEITETPQEPKETPSNYNVDTAVPIAKSQPDKKDKTTPSKSNKKRSKLGMVMLNIALILSIALLLVIVGFAAYLSGAFEGLF
jgi:hypothetical protein